MTNSLVKVGVTKQRLLGGAAASLLASTTFNVMSLGKNRTTKQQALKDITKRTTQGTIATASVVAATNLKNERNGTLKALTALGVGALGVYTVEKLDEKINSEDNLKQLKVQNEQ